MIKEIIKKDDDENTKLLKYEKLLKNYNKNIAKFLKGDIDIKIVEAACDMANYYYEYYHSTIVNDKKNFAMASYYALVAKEIFRIGTLCNCIKKNDDINIIKLDEKLNFYYHNSKFENKKFDLTEIETLTTVNTMKKDIENFSIGYNRVFYNSEYDIKIMLPKNDRFFLVLPKQKFAGFVRHVECKMYIKDRKNVLDHVIDELLVDEDIVWSGDATYRDVSLMTSDGVASLMMIIYNDLESALEIYDDSIIEQVKCELLFPEKISDKELVIMFKK